MLGEKGEEAGDVGRRRTVLEFDWCCREVKLIRKLPGLSDNTQLSLKFTGEFKELVFD